VAILAYLEMNTSNKIVLDAIRRILHENLQIATCLGFGPRYLHSTGQVYKGGPNTGVFLQLTADDTIDFPVPGKKYTFSVVKTAQALGEYQVLVERKRRIVRIHIKGNMSEGLATLQKTVKESCMSIVNKK
jgi:transaldolase/glucose-6-phosphate isomerase